MQNNIVNKKIHPYAYLYVWTTNICLGLVFVYVCINGGRSMSEWFLPGEWDTGNDFFNCIPAVKGYGLGYELVDMYPPLAKLFFLLIARIYSYDNIPLENTIRNSMTDPRMQQAALVPFIILILFVSIAIVVLVSMFFKDESLSGIIGASVIGTYSLLYAIERGNIICLSFMFLMYYIVFYKSQNTILKETALISLALSAGLKLYPAAFGLLLIFEKRWKDAIRAIIYGVLSIVIPSIIGKNYLLESATKNTASGAINWGKRLIDNFFGSEPLPKQIFFILAIFIALIGMIVIRTKESGKHWTKALYVGFFAIVCGVQFAYSYAYVFLIPALVLFLKEEKEISIKNNIYFILLCILNLPLPIFGTASSPNLRLVGACLVGEIKMWALFVTMILITVMEIFMNRTQKMLSD